MIEAKNLTRHHSTLAAIEDVSFKVEEDEILGFPEPDASGKTAAVRILPLSHGFVESPAQA